MTTDVIIPVLWLGTLTVSLVVTLVNLAGSINNRHYVHKRWPNHIARKRVADGSVRNQAIIVGIILLFMLAGIVGAASSAPRSGTVSLLLYGGLVGGVTLLMLLSILERRDRKRLMEG